MLCSPTSWWNHFRKHSTYVKMCPKKDSSSNHSNHLLKRCLLFDFALVLDFLCVHLLCVWNRKNHHHPKQMLLRADSISASVSVWKWTHTLSHTQKNHWCQWSWTVKCTKSFFGIRWLCLAYVICSMIFVAIPLPLRVEWIRWKLDLIRWWSEFLTKFVPCIALHCTLFSWCVCSCVCVFLLAAGLDGWVHCSFFVRCRFAYEHMPSNCLRLSSVFQFSCLNRSFLWYISLQSVACFSLMQLKFFCFSVYFSTIYNLSWLRLCLVLRLVHLICSLLKSR